MKNIEEWTKKITSDMLPTEYKYISDLIGVNNFILLTQELGGSSWYIPKHDSLLKEIRNKNIKKEFTGYNTKRLAKKYNLSERWIKEIVYDDIIRGQLSIFENIMK